jgi:hypothetical protein
MDIYDGYIPYVHPDADLFATEYEAQPRTLVDPRETALTANNPRPGQLEIPSATSVGRADNTSLSSSGTTMSSSTMATTTLISAGQSNLDTTRIMSMLGNLTQLWGISAMSGNSSQIFIIKDMLGQATAELGVVSGQYPQGHEVVNQAQARVMSLTGKLTELEAEQARLLGITAPPTGAISMSQLK